MQSFFQQLLRNSGILGEKETKSEQHGEAQVLLPEIVELPLPRPPQEEISIPASINGRDLSNGRL